MNSNCSNSTNAVLNLTIGGYDDVCGSTISTINNISNVTDGIYTTARYADTKMKKIEKTAREDTKTALKIKNDKIYVQYYKDGFYQSEKQIMPDIKSVDIFDLAVVVTFADGTKTKAVLDEEDHFNLERGVSICITKKLLGDDDGSAIYNKLIKRALKIRKNSEEAAAKEAQKKLEDATKKEKYRLRKQKRKERMREEKIEMIKEAYIRAIKEVGK